MKYLMFVFIFLAALAAASPSTDPVIRIGVPPWQGAVVKSAVVAGILGRAGFEVETTSGPRR